MSVSSVNPYLAALYAQYYTSGITATTGTQAGQSTSSASSTAIQSLSGVSGDTFELSSPTALAGYTAAMAGANWAQSGGGSTDNPVKSFLDKVAAGTVTDEDLASMQATLQTLAGGQSQNTTAASTDNPISSFLDKVAAGTVTDDDLKNMQTTLANMKAHKGHHHHHQASGNTETTSSSNDSSDQVKSFLDKVAAGTVTNDDLTSMQSLLQQWQQASGK